EAQVAEIVDAAVETARDVVGDDDDRSVRRTGEDTAAEVVGPAERDPRPAPVPEPRLDLDSRRREAVAPDVAGGAERADRRRGTEPREDATHGVGVGRERPRLDDAPAAVGAVEHDALAGTLDGERRRLLGREMLGH